MMVNKIKNNSTLGIYITEEQGGAIAANTPGEIDLDLLTLGTMYVYFDAVLRFEEKGNFNKESDDWIGFKTWAPGALEAQASTGGAMRIFYLITVEINETTAENLKRIAALNVLGNTTSGQGKLKYLVKQTASEAFEQFPDSSGVLKKATALIMRNYEIAEMAEPGKDVKLANIMCERITTR